MNAFLKAITVRRFTAALILLSASLLPAHSAAKSNAVWSLNSDIRDGLAISGNYYPTEFTVRHADSEGGHVQARVIKPGEPNCYALFDYRWTFSSPLDVVSQGDVIEVRTELSANPGPQCPPPLDPVMSFGPVEGRVINTDLVGTFTSDDRQLILWNGPTPRSNGRVSLPAGHPTGNTGDVFQLLVDDMRTANGSNRDAQRGGFQLSFEYRGSSYQVYYIFSAR